MKKFKSFITRRAKNEPVAYITHHKEFYGLDFYVDERVLIPRPETEQIVELTLHQLTTNNKQPTIVIDVGTGSGCIIISLAHLLQTKYPVLFNIAIARKNRNEFYGGLGDVKDGEKEDIKNIKNASENERENEVHGVSLIGIDISEDALEVARDNAKTHEVNDSIEFTQGNLLEPAIQMIKASNDPRRRTSSLRGRQKINLIITANLPYLTAEENSPSIEFEPKAALFAASNGVEFIHKLLQQITQLPNYPITLIIEHSPDQTQHITKLVKKLFPNASLETKKDLKGLDRISLLRL